MKSLHYIAFVLLVIGGLNWLLVGLFQWDVGALLGGMDAWLSRVVYILVGLAAIVELFAHKQTCAECGTGSSRSANRPSRPEQSQQPQGGGNQQ